MQVLLTDPLPVEIEEMLERRQRLGQDRRDEVWEGVLHVVPAPGHRHSALGAQLKRLLAPYAAAAGLTVTDDFNLGDSKHNFRIPDGGLHRPDAAEMWHPTAALVLEILSPGDETPAKLPFYAAHDVDEILIADPNKRSLEWLGLIDGKYEPIARSGLVDLSPADLAEQIDWR